MTLNRTEAARIEVDNALTEDGQGIPVKVISGGGGGIGGDASAANQATEITKLTSIDGKLPAALGGAGGLKVEVVASSGGGLTDTELRATPVPVSGPLTDTQLRATPVPVAVSGGATSAKQDTGNSSLASIDAKDFATQTTLALVLLKLADILTELGQKTEPLDSQHVQVDSLPAGLATGAKQDTGNASLASIDGKVATETTLAAVRTAVETIDNFISGSRGLVTEDNSAAIALTLTNLLTELQQKLEPADLAGLATSAKQDTGNASLAALTLAQAADGASTLGPMVQALADDAPPQRITGMIYPLSLTADGRLRVAATQSNADHDFWGDMEPGFGLRQNDFWQSMPAYYTY